MTSTESKQPSLRVERFTGPLAFLAGIHGNLAALDAVLADIDRRGVDVIVNLGDILSGPLQPRETADRLIARGLPTIRGNHERQLLTDDPARMGASDRFAAAALRPDQRAWLERLPATLQLSDDVFLCHGTPDSDLVYFLETVDASGPRPASLDEVERRAGDVAASLVFCGHTHTPRVVRRADGRTIVNPGSVGLQAFAWDVPRPHTMATGSPHARYAIAERVGAGWEVEAIAVAYDWDSAARLAGARGEPAWATGLRAGRL